MGIGKNSLIGETLWHFLLTRKMMHFPLYYPDMISVRENQNCTLELQYNKMQGDRETAFRSMCHLKCLDDSEEGTSACSSNWPFIEDMVVQ